MGVTFIPDLVFAKSMPSQYKSMKEDELLKELDELIDEEGIFDDERKRLSREPSQNYFHNSKKHMDRPDAAMLLNK